MLRRLVLCSLVLLSESGARSQTVQTLSVPADSPRWELEGETKAAEHQGRKCLLLNGGGASLKDFVMRDGVVDVDVATPASRVVLGFSFGLRTRSTPSGFISDSTSPACRMLCNIRRCSTLD
jgi:hypothetical protein